MKRRRKGEDESKSVMGRRSGLLVTSELHEKMDSRNTHDPGQEPSGRNGDCKCQGSKSGSGEEVR